MVNVAVTAHVQSNHYFDTRKLVIDTTKLLILFDSNAYHSTTTYQAAHPYY